VPSTNKICNAESYDNDDDDEDGFVSPTITRIAKGTGKLMGTT